MRSDLVVLPEPNIDSDLGLSCGVEPFCVEDFFSQGTVKAFVIPIFPWRAREPPHLKWSTVIFRKRRTENGEQDVT